MKNRELLKISKEKEKNPGDYALGADDQVKTEDGSVSANKVIQELKNKVHLRSEENEILFQQITVLRAQYDQFNKDHQERSDEANKKIGMFAQVQKELQLA